VNSGREKLSSSKAGAPIKLAIIGCGAVTELSHLPAAAKVWNLQVTVLVDKNRSRAEALGRQYGVPHVAEDYTQVWDKVDAAIVALPHCLHAPVSIDLLAHGVHVLVEKPMALSGAECDAIIQAAEQGRTVLAVGLMRRFQRSAQFTKAILDTDWLGHIESFDVQEGFVYNWPVASDFFFRKEAAGGGVLIDTGAHTLDTLLWWLGDSASLEYFDDNYGGVEADCELRLVMKCGATGIVKLSRTHNLRGTAIIRGTRATLEVSLHSNQVKLRPTGMAFDVVGHVLPDWPQAQREQSYVDLISAQLTDWLNAIRSGHSPAVPGVEGRRSVELIEACYAQRKPLVLPWMAPGMMRSSAAIGEVAR